MRRTALPRPLHAQPPTRVPKSAEALVAMTARTILQMGEDGVIPLCSFRSLAAIDVSRCLPKGKANGGELGDEA